jgi:phosphoglycerol transferase MdoB-like AlkP superfamily enzyme
MAGRFALQLLKTFLYYLLLFAICRLVFLLYFFQEVSSEGTQYFFLSLWKALPLDLSAACYLLFIPLILYTLSYLFPHVVFSGILKIYLLITTFLIIFLSIAEIGIYREVHVKLYFNLLSHLKHADEILRSVSWPLLITLLGLIAVIFYFFIRLTNVFLLKKQETNLKHSEIIQIIIVFLVAVPLMVIGCRGGIQPIPINEAEVYFSHNQCVNDATVNPLWNLAHSFIETKKVLNDRAYKEFSNIEARQIVEDLYAVPVDTTISLFKSSKPNVCFLILESWSAELIESLDGYQGITPNFEALAREGYLFTHLEAAGHLSDQGIPGILSGYPALPIGSAINQPGKHPQLPSINKELKKAGYSSSFYFGGQLIYGNIKSYIYYNQFDRIIEQADLPSSIPAGRLGIHDSIMLNLWSDSLKQMKEPFFSCLFTVSTHSPYDAVKGNLVNMGTMEDKYLSTVVYCDRQIGRFFAEAKKQPWYANTIFVLVADHSHSTPKNYDYCSPEFYHIPMLMVGGALREEFRGKKYENVASQVDIPSTLLHQLQMDSRAYRWSKNLMNPTTRPFSFYTFDAGFCLVEPNQYVIWNKKFPTTNRNTAPTPQEKALLHKRGFALFQTLIEDFLSK